MHAENQSGILPHFWVVAGKLQDIVGNCLDIAVLLFIKSPICPMCMFDSAMLDAYARATSRWQVEEQLRCLLVPVAVCLNDARMNE